LIAKSQVLLSKSLKLIVFRFEKLGNAWIN
jgi:hypothetical protein